MLNLLDHIVVGLTCLRCHYRFRVALEQMRGPSPLRCPSCNEPISVGMGPGQLDGLATAWRVVQQRLQQMGAEVGLRS